MDKFDLAILRIVQKDLRQTTDAIGEQVGLSGAAVSRRLQRLREKSVIRSEVALVSPASVGVDMCFVVGVELEREQLDVLDDIKTKLAGFDEVQQCYYVTGEFDLILVVRARNMSHYEEFTHAAFFGNRDVRRFNTSVVMSEAKVSLELPIS